MSQKNGHGKTFKAYIAFATYVRKQWERLREISVDRKDLENTWEEWNSGKEEQLARLRESGLEVNEVLLDVAELQEYCRQRGIPIDSAARSEYAAKLRQKGR